MNDHPSHLDFEISLVDESSDSVNIVNVSDQPQPDDQSDDAFLIPSPDPALRRRPPPRRPVSDSPPNTTVVPNLHERDFSLAEPWSVEQLQAEAESRGVRVVPSLRSRAQQDDDDEPDPEPVYVEIVLPPTDEISDASLDDQVQRVEDEAISPPPAPSLESERSRDPRTVVVALADPDDDDLLLDEADAVEVYDIAAELDPDSVVEYIDPDLRLSDNTETDSLLPPPPPEEQPTLPPPPRLRRIRRLLTDLQPNAILHVLSFLLPRDLYRAGQVCSVLRHVGSSELLWNSPVAILRIPPDERVVPPLVDPNKRKSNITNNTGETRRLLEETDIDGFGRAVWAFETYQRRPWSLSLLRNSFEKNSRSKRQRNCGLWCGYLCFPLGGASCGVIGIGLLILCVGGWVTQGQQQGDDDNALLLALECLGMVFSLASVCFCGVIPLAIQIWEDLFGDCCASRARKGAREDAEAAAQVMGRAGRDEFQSRSGGSIQERIESEFSGSWENSTAELMVGYGSLFSSVFVTVAMTPVFVLGVFLKPLIGIGPSLVVVCALMMCLVGLFCCGSCLLPSCLTTFQREGREGGVRDRRIARWRVSARTCSFIQLIPLFCVVLPWAVIVPTQLAAILFSREYEWGDWLPLVGLPVWVWVLLLVVGSVVALGVGVLLHAHICSCQCHVGSIAEEDCPKLFQGCFALGILNVLTTVPYCVAVGLMAVKGSEWISICFVAAGMSAALVVGACLCCLTSVHYRLWSLKLPRNLSLKD